MVNLSVLIGLGVLLFLVVLIGYFFYGLQPFDGNTAKQDFVIERGESFKSVSARLSQGSLVKSLAVFKMYMLVTGQAQNIKPGTYELSNAMTVPQIVDEITSSQRNDVLVTIPEGSSVRDIGKILEESHVIAKESDISDFPVKSVASDYPFLARANSFEGFLFPETYYFERNSSPEVVVRKMLDTFEKRAWPMLNTTRDWYERLILASYLEREVPEFENRQLVAGVLLRRINLSMPLQVDATLSYIKCSGLLRDCKNIKVLRSDLGLVSPYNTYSHLGWTPTPIANPGEAAIQAALTPRFSSYLYYLSSPETKETYFSKTLDEHNAKRKKYLSS